MTKWEIEGVTKLGLPIRLSGDSTDPVALDDGLYRWKSEIPLELKIGVRRGKLRPGRGIVGIGLPSKSSATKFSFSDYLPKGANMTATYQATEQYLDDEDDEQVAKCYSVLAKPAYATTVLELLSALEDLRNHLRGKYYAG